MDSVTKLLKKIRYNSPVILTFSLLSFAVLLLGAVTDNRSTFLLFSVRKGSFTDPLFYFRLFGHVLGHANYTHFLNNFLFILLVGPMLEEKYGSLHMFFMIAITALVTGLTYALFFDVNLLGASGVVFMLILLSSFVNIEKGGIPLTLILCFVVFIGREVFDGLTVQSNVANLGHIIGGVCGAGFGFAINRGKADKITGGDENEEE